MLEKKNLIKLVKIKNTEDEQLSFANNRLGTTSPARDLSFYAETFVVGGLAESNCTVGNDVFNPIDRR